MKRIIGIILSMVLMISMTACGQTAEKPTQQSGLKIYASFYPMQFLASQIAGDKAQVISLVPAGVEPHDWEPKPKTLADIQKADMLIYNGAGMESWLNKLLSSIEKAGVKTVNASQGLELIPFNHQEEEEEEEHGHEELAYDPHVWVSPAKYKQQAENIFHGLVEKDPANEAYYKANYDKLAAQLEKLDQDYRTAAASFQKKTFIVSHAAFEYLAKEYGLTQIAIRGVTPEAEPSPAKMAELVKLCEQNDIRYIFFESLVSPRLSQALAKEINAGVLVLNDGQGISQEEIDSGKSYITIMYENLENLKKALMQ